MKYRALTFLSFFFCLKTFSQNEVDSIKITDLQPVTVSAYRLEENDLQSLLPVSSIGAYRLQQAQQQLALDESLSAVPGVFVQNADNFAQDIRVSIRGFGARAAFGIRGLKILVDGIPETTPDGQGQVDNIDPAMLSSLEVLRGAAAGLYGNASGGVIRFTTLDANSQPRREFSASLGSQLFQKYQFNQQGWMRGKFFHKTNIAYTQTNGYRQHSAMQSMALNSGLILPFNDSSGQVKILLNLVRSPKAEDAGGINLEEVESGPDLARDRNLQFKADEALTQGKLGLVVEKAWRQKHRFSSTGWCILRDFENKLPFEAGGIVELRRVFFGQKLAYMFTHSLFGMPYRLSAGLDLEGQQDYRSRFDNLQGESGPEVFDQQESFYNAGAFLIQQLSPGEKWRINLGLRFDALLLKADDRFLGDGDDSGQQQYGRFNPIAGIGYSFSEGLNLYGNVSTAFETPALSELSANPTGGGGFNPDLQPQEALNVEIGTKGFIKKAKLRYELALFHIRLKNELVPFELADFPGRIFYKNAANSVRSGLEIGSGTYLGKGFYAFANYTYSHFEYRDYPLANGNLKGKALPGIPRHLGYLELRYFKTQGLFGLLQLRAMGRQFADDANSVAVDPYFTANARLGFIQIFKNWEIEPSLGLNNLFDQFYYANIRINAAAGRYYEPAAGLQVFGSLKLRNCFQTPHRS
jgi:iron complex outermembrane receptor protein